MKQELELKLVEAFPLLYRQYGKDICCLDSFGCSDGWYDLLFELSTNIDNVCKELNITADAYPAAVQVKSKFGTLRFYTNGMKEPLYSRIHKLINDAEIKSATTCEMCGEAAIASKQRGWIVTVCQAHQQKR